MDVLVKKSGSDGGALHINNLHLTGQTDVIQAIFDGGNRFAANQDIFFANRGRCEQIGVLDNRKHGFSL